MRSRFLKELAQELDLPQETRRLPMGYSDYDDPDDYGNAAYGGGRYENTSRNSYGGYGKTYGRSSDYADSKVTRSTWNGNSYGAPFGATQKRTAQNSSGFTYGGKTSVTPKAPTKDLSVFKSGVRVVHPKFGVGTIISVRGMGANTILDIAFEGLGIKQLSANLAPLTVM
jgi:DNA helicase-2/ATP-dependent DNA helicase PcrA